MRKPHHQVQDDSEEEEEEGSEEEEEGSEEEEEDCFYESLDRIVSSSASSAATSFCSSPVDEDQLDRFDNASDRVFGNFTSTSPSSTNSASAYSNFDVNKSHFAMGIASKYDIWISQPVSSIQERRIRLLSQMGLSSDLSLSRVKPISDHFNRSISADHLSGCKKDKERDFSRSTGGNDCVSGVGPMLRSKSEGSDSAIVSTSTTVIVDSKNNHVNDSLSGGGGCSHVLKSSINGLTNNKPPSGKNMVYINKRESLESDSLPVLPNEGVLSMSGNIGIDEEDQVCLIKNLDNGKEFVVKEIREDGMWNKLKEVGTGRQLTMEEFEMSVGHSPIVQELMRRQNVEDGNTKSSSDLNGSGSSGSGLKPKKKGSWLKSIKNVASSIGGQKERRSSDDRDTSSEKGGRRSSSATDDSQDVSFHGPERVRVKQYGKSCKELSALYKSQEIRAHNGSIWSIKFSLDGRYLASAGEDCVIHVWQVLGSERKGDMLLDKPEDGNLNFLFLTNGSPEPSTLSPNVENQWEKKRRGRNSISRKSVSLDHIVVPETVFGLSEKPICSFQGHLDDVLDLSWSKSQHLLSSSMDKTVRLWHLSSKTCLKVFSHSDYVTCIQFNPVDDRYFISGSLDSKVRIWSIPDHQVVDWNDLHEMVTAACYTPDGQGALVGSYKGSCRLYNTSENKLQHKGQINLQNKKKKSHQKKITGFQFAPGSLSEVLVTSADSRVRVIDGVDLVHKFKGFRNTNSQIAASVTTNGKYVVSASEDSNVYVWKHEAEPQPSRSKGVTVTRSYEHFHCQEISVAIPWPGMDDSLGLQDIYLNEQNGLDSHLDEDSTVNHPPNPVEETNGNEGSPLASGSKASPLHGTMSGATNGYFDRISATWPEEKLLLATKNRSPHASLDFSNGVIQNRSAWGMVIVTAGLKGEIRTFQNFGLPVRI